MKQLILFLIVFMAGCKSEPPSIPKDVLPVNDMVQIMADVHVVDVVAADKATGGLDEKALTKFFMKQIYKNRGITEQKFLDSYRFYESHPVLFDKMYGEVLEELSRREAAIANEK